MSRAFELAEADDKNYDWAGYKSDPETAPYFGAESHEGYPLGIMFKLIADSPARDVRLNIGDKIEIKFFDERDQNLHYAGTFTGIKGNVINEAWLFFRTKNDLEIGVNVADIKQINPLD